METTEITEQNNTWQLATSRQRWGAFLATICAGPVLAIGFLPTSRDLYALLAPHLPLGLMAHYARDLCFPLLAVFFHVSIPRRHFGVSQKVSTRTLVQMSLLPMVVALVFGGVRSGPSVISTPWAIMQPVLWWNVICISVGEEAIFRGWYYTLMERLYPRRFFSVTLPLPVSVWASAFAFSIWHLQNAGVEPPAFVAFQMIYTFFIGLWLGFLRWKKDGIWAPILAHALLNLASLVL
jgi:membrane protease YdiL (CAAX protease family)